jgi:small neutral amino acid transporter SnatA (MarC family)
MIYCGFSERSSCFYYLYYFSYLIHHFHFYFQKLEATAFAPRTVIGIAIGAGSLAGGILLFCVIWRLWRRSNDKDVKFEQQQDKINSEIPAIPPSTFPKKPTEKSQYII